MFPRSFVGASLVSIAAGCGTGGGGGDGSDGGAVLPTPVALVFVSGHFSLDEPARSYLDRPGAIGPFLVDALETAGYAPTVAFFVDGDDEPGGFVDLVAHLTTLRDSAASPVIVVAHSHGGAWATRAAAAVPDLPIRLFVHLDTNSLFWTSLHDADETAALGGDPEGRFDLGVASSCAAFPGAPNEAGTSYDLEDVVPESVVESLEVRSGETAPFSSEPFDEHWNLRSDGTAVGFTCLFTGTAHTEVFDASGTTVPVVRDWILERLAADGGP